MDQHQVGLFSGQHGLEARQNVACDVKQGENLIQHFAVRGCGLKTFDDRRHLDGFWAGTEDDEYFFGVRKGR